MKFLFGALSALVSAFVATNLVAQPVANSQSGAPVVPPSLAVPATPVASGTVLVSKDDLAFVQSALQIGGGLFAVLAVVFGAVVGVNVFNAASILKDAREELNSAKEEMLALRKARQDYESGVTGLKVELDKLTNESISKVKAEAQRSFDTASKKLYRKSKLDEYIKEIWLELAGVTPDESKLYPKVTALVGYLDEEIISLYLEIFRKLPPNSELVQEVLKNGFKGLPALLAQTADH